MQEIGEGRGGAGGFPVISEQSSVFSQSTAHLQEITTAGLLVTDDRQLITAEWGSGFPLTVVGKIDKIIMLSISTIIESN